MSDKYVHDGQAIQAEHFDALVDACVADGYSFGAITKEVRSEWNELSLREAIVFTAISLKRRSQEHDALSDAASKTLKEWSDKYGNGKILEKL